MLDKIALALTIIGGLNWGSIGLFRFDIVAWIFGGQTAVVSRIVYTLVALSAIWCISLLFRTDMVSGAERHRIDCRLNAHQKIRHRNIPMPDFNFIRQI